ncbi:inorganic phosphate transporter [Thraustotheca clavata]|uniref:Inorganic phosphate transporter n=1 Tax=Thraustotheca clavata TaxID=74557 RepID=A0A1V9ZBR5_9STRA|nr:inorganic phosphate transporter [Thraustotheca clavata]
MYDSRNTKSSALLLSMPPVPDVPLEIAVQAPCMEDSPLLKRSDSISETINRRVLVSAVANFSTAYNLAIIGSAVLMVKETSPGSDVSAIPAVSACSLLGAIAGQLLFGYIGDVLGRRKGMVLTLTLSVIGALLSAILPFDGSVYAILAACRFLLGVGVGGVYPLSAASAAEGSSDPVLNNKRVAAVFSFQGWGQLASFLLTFVLLKSSLNHAIVWRILLAAGALPGIIVLHEAIVSKETGAFLQNQANPNKMSVWTALKTYERQFIGTSMGWFLFDITFYGNILFTPVILQDLYHASTMVETIQFSVLTSAIALPGYYLSLYMIGKMDFKHIQMQGFAIMAIIFLAMGIFYEALLPLKALLFTMYAFTFFFSNFGPNVSTFSLPAELFPTEVRVQLNGMSAAAGKVGAAIGAYIYGLIEASYGVSAVLIVSGLVSLLGFAITYVCIPCKQYR